MVLWRSIVSRMGDVLTEAAHSAFILASKSAPSEHHEREPGESEPVFVRNVLDRAAIIWSRQDEAFRESIRRHPGPDTHQTR